MDTKTHTQLSGINRWNGSPLFPNDILAKNDDLVHYVWQWSLLLWESKWKTPACLYDLLAPLWDLYAICAQSRPSVRISSTNTMQYITCVPASSRRNFHDVINGKSVLCAILGRPYQDGSWQWRQKPAPPHWVQRVSMPPTTSEVAAAQKIPCWIERLVRFLTFFGFCKNKSNASL